MHAPLYSLALLATAAFASSPGCPYLNWTDVTAIQTFNDKGESEIVDRNCNVLPISTLFQAIGDIQNSTTTRIEYTNMPWLVDVERATWPRAMTSLTLQNVGVKSLQCAWPPDMGSLMLSNMAIDALPANLPKDAMRIKLENATVAHTASIAAMRPTLLALWVIKNLELENTDYGGLQILDISSSHVKSISNVQLKNMTILNLFNATIESIRGMQIRDLNEVWLTNTHIFNWSMDDTTFNVLNSIVEKHDDSGTAPRGYQLQDSSMMFDKSLCDKQSGALKTLWTQANMTVCVLAQPSIGSNTGVIIPASAASVVVLAGLLLLVYRKKAAAMKPEHPEFLSLEAKSTN
ncbi:Aste57867_12560 [Aphanomyces stellatus]|uniref:Aste57867_12560 protein n=1 Tax=Aphanomyces stellatus TaxID=120398 RepID=A0A485KVX0_9STRA|nr:hypothetical protein As57867_012514 [Aphanomyces stellatus]VFT89411.1 Aste57867_12560 [Aphanomyces stellatus]